MQSLGQVIEDVSAFMLPTALYQGRGTEHPADRLSQGLDLIRFLFVRPALCFQLPSDFTSRQTLLPFSYHFPLPGM